MIGGRENGICSFGGVYIYHTLMRMRKGAETDRQVKMQINLLCSFGFETLLAAAWCGLVLALADTVVVSF
jgi:hypothetical protein